MAEDEETTGTDEGTIETSLDELLQRKERRTTSTSDGDDNDEDALLEAMEEREGRGSESLTVKVVPPQPSEFTCRGCFLLKHRSQLADKKKTLCRDCA